MKSSGRIFLKVFLVYCLGIAVLALFFKVFDAIDMAWGFIVFLGGAIAAVFYYLFKKFFMPLSILRQGLHIVLDGNLDYRIRNLKKDELGQFAQLFDKLTDSLKKCSDENETLRQKEDKTIQGLKHVSRIEEQFLKLFENPNYGIFFCDFDSRIQDVNQTACTLLQYSKEEMLQISFDQFFEKSEIQKSRAATRLRGEDNAIRFESLFRRRDGSSFPVEISSNIADLDKEKVLYVVQDIEKRKRIEHQLRESEERFRSFMESANDMMFIADHQGVLQYVNLSMIHTFGYSTEQFREMTVFNLFNDHLQNTPKLVDLITDGIQFHEMTWITQAQKKIRGELKATGIFSENGEFLGLRGVFRDISERKKIEESQRLAQLGKMLASVTHEIKNQLTAILGMSELSMTGNSSKEDLVEDFKVVFEQAQHMNEFVHRLLTFSKPSQGQMKPVQMNEVVRLVIRLVEKQFVKSQVEIDTVLMESLQLVLADEKQMSEVILNLIQNAFEAIDPPGRVTVRTAFRDKVVEVAVSDTGSGISEENLKHIFDPFFTTKENGTGLGLSVCYGIVESHQGHLEYHSQAGKGTTAVLMLPVYNPS